MKLLPICKSLAIWRTSPFVDIRNHKILQTWRFDVCFVAYSRDFWGTISSVAAFSFISYVFISIFAILNVVTGVFCTLSRFGSFLFGSFRKGCSTEPSSCQFWFVRFFWWLKPLETSQPKYPHLLEVTELLKARKQTRTRWRENDCSLFKLKYVFCTSMWR